MNNHFTIVISTRNSVQFINRCLDSVLAQTYDHFDVIFLDADSTDGTYEEALKYRDKHSNFTAIKNETRKFQGENILIAVKMAKPGSIIVTVDGDDFLPHNNVLQIVDKYYREYDCWMTYGTYVEHPHRSVSHIYMEYPLEVREKKQFREYRWLASHLRTFKRELFLKINEDDLKDSRTNNFYSYAPDLSFQFPMLEMCGSDKSKYLSDILYVYNVANPLNENKVAQGEIDIIEEQIRKKNKYETLKEL